MMEFILGLLFVIVVIIHLLSIDALLQRGTKQNEEIIELLKQINEKIK
ncbi:hypothetical protein MHZ92_12025 [Sporosarcina sp. ACRSL]|nr:hypothetical protein [Sporosarcina sp. ACRSL]